jgi:phosphoglycolate phosphatase
LDLIAMPAPTIVYGLDGTLADTAEDLVATLNHLLGREGLAPLPVESAGSLLGAGARALIKRGFAAAGRSLDPQEMEALFADYLTYYSAHIVVHTRLYPGVDKALATFARAGWRQAVCTNKTEGLAKLLITKLGIAERFAFICGQDTFGVAKPDPKPLLETIAAVGGSRQRAIMVGDSETDIKTARAAGAPVVAVDFGYADTPVKELGPDRVISHFDELMQACDAISVADQWPDVARTRDKLSR